MPFWDSVNMARTRAYIVANGFPNFEKVGFWDDSSPFESGIIFIEFKSALDSLIEAAVLEGNFRPDDWGAILMTREKPDSCIYCMKIWQVPEQITKEREEKINEKRQSIYLPDIAQHRMMWNYIQENRERSTMNYNSSLYPINESTREQFVLLNDFLVPSKFQIQMGVN